MLKEMVENVLEDTTINRNFFEVLPTRLQLFSNDLFSRMTQHSLEENPLTVSAKGRTNAIFQFICYVLDTKIDKLKKIQFIILHIFHHVDDFEEKGPIFERILEYFDGTDDVKERLLIGKFVEFYTRNHMSRVSTKQLSFTIHFLSKIVKIQCMRRPKISNTLPCLQLNLQQDKTKKWKSLLHILADREKTIGVAFIQGKDSKDFPIEKLPNTYQIIYSSEKNVSDDVEEGFAAILVRRSLIFQRISSAAQQVSASKLFAGIELFNQRSGKSSNLYSVYGCQTTDATIRRLTNDRLVSKIPAKKISQNDCMHKPSIRREQ